MMQELALSILVGVLVRVFLGGLIAAIFGDKKNMKKKPPKFIVGPWWFGPVSILYYWAVQLGNTDLPLANEFQVMDLPFVIGFFSFELYKTYEKAFYWLKPEELEKLQKANNNNKKRT